MFKIYIFSFSEYISLFLIKAEGQEEPEARNISCLGFERFDTCEVDVFIRAGELYIETEDNLLTNVETLKKHEYGLINVCELLAAD